MCTTTTTTTTAAANTNDETRNKMNTQNQQINKHKKQTDKQINWVYLFQCLKFYTTTHTGVSNEILGVIST